MSKPKERPLPGNTDQILAYLHCALCMAEQPDGVSPRDWARIQVGWTEIGLQVWCVRHDANILHVDFEGICHPGNTHRANEN